MRYLQGLIFVSLVVMAVILQSSAAFGGGSGKGVGVRAGLGVDPDQFVAGVQSVMGRAAKIARFAPSVDIGFGDNVTVVTFNPDFRLLFSPPKSPTVFYGQVGPTIAIIDPKKGDSDTEIGVTLSAGMKLPMGDTNFYTLEGRVGIGDVPDLRILFGVLFGGGKGRDVTAKP